MQSTSCFSFEFHQILSLLLHTLSVPFPGRRSIEIIFSEIGGFIALHSMRISMHPDQFVLINSPSEEIFEKSIRDLIYHEEVLSLLGLDSTHKIQIHVGGMYGDKTTAIERFVKRFEALPERIKKRLVIENDDRLFSLKDTLEISSLTGIPVLFDTLHHEVVNNSESFHEAFGLFTKTWKTEDGIPMIDYSDQDPEGRRGKHKPSIDLTHFKNFLQQVKGFDFDIMFEIKDKESSALKAKEIVRSVKQ